MHVVAEGVLLEIDAAANGQQRAPPDVKLVAFCVTAEIIVVVEDQDLLVRPCLLAIQVGGGEATDPTTDDHQVVALVRCGVFGGLLSAPCQGMRNLERSVVAAAQSGQDRGVVVRASPAGRRSELALCQQISGRKRRTGRQSESSPVEEVPSGNHGIDC